MKEDISIHHPKQKVSDRGILFSLTTRTNLKITHKSSQHQYNDVGG